MRDIRLAVRRLLNRRGFALVAIATLALGIGAPTAIFSVVRAVLIQPLQYPEPDRLVRFRLEGRSPRGAVSFDAVPAQAALAWAQETTTLAGLALYNDRALTLSTSEGPFRLTGQSATPNLFEILGVAPARGRTFRSNAPDAREIVFSHAAWSRYFSSDPAALDSLVTLDGAPYRVVGVMPEAFGFPSPEVAFWVPLILEAGSTRGMVLPAVARMKPGTTLAAVIEEGRATLGDEGDPGFQHTLNGDTLKNQMVGGVRRALWVLLGAVGFVLAIATANIALLLLVRGASRAREFSIQLSLGASRAVLLRQLLVESLTLGAIGGAVGLFLAWLGLDLLLKLAPPEMPRLQGAAIDGPVIGVAAILTLATSLMFGALSAGRTLVTRAFVPLRLRLNVLATCVLALTMVLLVGAGLLLRSFLGLVLIDPGFETRGALALQINLPDARYPGSAARLAFLERLTDELRSVAGVGTMGLATTLPNRQPTGRFILSSTPMSGPPDPFSMPVYDVHMVTKGFIEAMGLRMVSGRSFGDQDGAGDENVAVISEQLAAEQFPNRSAIGQWLYSGSGDRRVVGVVGDLGSTSPGVESKPAAYIPLLQNSSVLEWFRTVTVIVRSNNPDALRAPLRARVLSMDSGMPPFNVRRVDEDMARALAGPRFNAVVLGVFGGLSLLMAAIGVSGVVAYSTSLRTKEIGIRIALGASRGQVLRALMRDGVLMVGAGLAVGLTGAVLLAQTLTSLLHDVTPADPAILTAVAAILATSSLAAAFLPVRRAARINAIEALREE